MQREKEIALELRCVARIETCGGLALKLALVGLRGFPDRVVFHGGRAWCAEFKRPVVGRVAAQQTEWKNRLARVGIRTYLVNNDADFIAAMEAEGL